MSLLWMDDVRTESRTAQPAIAADKHARARFALPYMLAAEWRVGPAKLNGPPGNGTGSSWRTHTLHLTRSHARSVRR